MSPEIFTTKVSAAGRGIEENWIDLKLSKQAIGGHVGLRSLEEESREGRLWACQDPRKSVCWVGRGAVRSQELKSIKVAFERATRASTIGKIAFLINVLALAAFSVCGALFHEEGVLIGGTFLSVGLLIINGGQNWWLYSWKRNCQILLEAKKNGKAIYDYVRVDVRYNKNPRHEWYEFPEKISADVPRMFCTRWTEIVDVPKT
jgi:hypothetical protein